MTGVQTCALPICFFLHTDELRVEKGFSPDTIKLLEAKGQKVALKEAMGSTQSIMVLAADDDDDRARRRALTAADIPTHALAPLSSRVLELDPPGGMGLG